MSNLCIRPWVAGNEVIVKNVNANIPVSLSWFLLPFLAFLCFPASAQFIASSCNGLSLFLCKSKSKSLSKARLGHYELEAMN